jgi:serine/threonine protein kinase
MEYVGQTSDNFANYLKDAGLLKALRGYILDVLRSVANALEYIHLQDMLHRDIKPANILITDVGQAKLADFGLACQMLSANDDKCKTVKEECCPGLAGTPAYIAPEVYNYKISVPASDVWSLGATLYYLYYNTYIWPTVTKGAKLNREDVAEIIINTYPSSMNSGNKRLDDLVNAMTVKDYKDRISIHDILSRF